VNRSLPSAAVAALLLGVVRPVGASDGPGQQVAAAVDPVEHSAGDAALDRANAVRTAAKEVTTVQRAPAIVTVISGEEIQARGITRLDDLLATVPGWLRLDAMYGQFSAGLTRGTANSVLYMQNGMPLFEPGGNVPSMGRAMPIELVDRVELITGPAGVLWGANAYLGVVNVVTKGADAVAGVQAEVRTGHGPGDRELLRGHLLAGVPGRDLSLLFHAGFEAYRGPALEMPQRFFGPLPAQPNGPVVYGPLTAAEPGMSAIVHLNGKLTLGPVDMYLSAPFAARQVPLGMAGHVVEQDLAEDALGDDSGRPVCSFVAPELADGQRNPEAFSGDDPCVDRGRLARAHGGNLIDRYLLATYGVRSAGGRAGAAVRLYGVQFDRSFADLGLLAAAPAPLLEGGLGLRLDQVSYRLGSSVEARLHLPGAVRVLYGGEAFREWLPDGARRSRQGAGSAVTVTGPYDLDRVPVGCPRMPDPDNPGQTQFVRNCPLTATFVTDRTVLGAYLNPRWQLADRLEIEGGVRIQAAPAVLATSSYAPQVLWSAAAVVGPVRNWHLKLNYAEGLRAPVFHHTHGNGNALQIEGNPDLELETSQAVQAEANARLFRNQGPLRELAVRTDYSYTRLDNLIEVVGGAYANTSPRGIHSVEFLGKMYLEGGHVFELGYTWLHVATADRGYLRGLPEHWFVLTGIYNLVDGVVQASSTLNVTGAMEDANLLVEHRDRRYTGQGLVGPDSTVLVQPYELVLDRLPPAVQLTVGVTYLDAFGVKGVQARAFVYNALNARSYNPAASGELEPQLEVLPNPYPDMRGVVSLAYQY
jgi:outer membrane receptor protein involved in Fe transport